MAEDYSLKFLPYLRMGLGANANVGPRYIFSLSQDCIGELDNGPLSEVPIEFQNNGRAFTSQQPKLTVEQQGIKWTIADNDQCYLICFEDQALNVYELDYLHRSKDIKVKVVNQAGNSLLKETHSITLRGPADIIGFHGSVVARTEPESTEPRNNTNDFEPNYFPFIEFIDPDFPWRYSLAGPDPQHARLIPWIILLVLTRDAFTLEQIALNEQQFGTKLIVNEKGFSQLPDLGNAWAWAHVHFSGGVSIADESGLAASLSNQPERNCSRLLCPRKLDPLTLYSAFVVPLYEIGRLAGLGQVLPESVAEADVNKTWDPKTWNNDLKQGIELPVYYQWDFQTGESGDFEDLIHKIVPDKCPEDVGKRQVDGSNPGFLEAKDYGPFELEGALLPLQSESAPLNPTDSFSKEISPELQRSFPYADEGDDDPLITIPIYGQQYQRIDPTTFDPNNFDTTSWVREINLDRRYRVPGGIGTQVVQMNQEDYIDLCWKQVGAIRETNEEIRRSAVGKMISERLKVRQLDNLGDERFIAVTSPFHHYAASGIFSYQRRFSQTGLPRGLLTATARRVLFRLMWIDLQ